MNDYTANLLGVEAPAPSDSSIDVETGWSATSTSGTTGTRVEPGIGARARSMFKQLFFDIIRPLFVRDIKPGEEFLCEECRGPMLRRVVFCSQKCHNAHCDRWIKRYKSHQ